MAAAGEFDYDNEDMKPWVGKSVDAEGNAEEKEYPYMGMNQLIQDFMQTTNSSKKIPVGLSGQWILFTLDTRKRGGDRALWFQHPRCPGGQNIQKVMEAEGDVEAAQRESLEDMLCCMKALTRGYAPKDIENINRDTAYKGEGWEKYQTAGEKTGPCIPSMALCKLYRRWYFVSNSDEDRDFIKRKERMVLARIQGACRDGLGFNKNTHIKLDGYDNHKLEPLLEFAKKHQEI